MKDIIDRMDSEGERFGRVKKPTAPEILELRHKRSDPTPLDVASYYCQILIHRAHVVMLTEQGILSREEGKKILKGITSVEETAKGNEKLMSYMSTETTLIEKIGTVGGKMHIGRSRNDLGVTQRRIFYRDQIERLIAAVIKFQKALLRAAEENVNTVMPGYTHWRQAQPITLGHYLVAHVDAAGRTVSRLEDLYKRTNLNTLGAAALAGTGWPIDRFRTMELLGFDELCENTYDCVAAHDYIFELASDLAIHMSNLSRLAEDLQIWSSDEFAMIDLNEAYAGTSSIMPQKKNPSSLEWVKLYAAESIGALAAIASSIKGIQYGLTLERVNVEPITVDTVIGSTNIMAGVVSTFAPMKETMLIKASKGYSTMTELADTLVKDYGFSFRQAHDIVARTTLNLISEGKTADQITTTMIEEAALDSVGIKIEFSMDVLRASIDPIENVKKRRVIGGPAPEEVKRMIDDRWKQINIAESKCKKRLEKIEKSLEELEEAVKNITH